MIWRALAGVALAAAVAAVAVRTHALSRGGGVAAVITGAVTVAAGWGFGVLLASYFASSVMLSRFRAAVRERRTGDIVAKRGPRDAAQVLANGGVFAGSAFLSVVLQAPHLAAAALGALAAATADTWATEIGTLSEASPRSLITFVRVPAGTSGGVTLIGTLAMIAGALFIALTSVALELATPALAIALGGVAGALADSLLGATLQERRWCAACNLSTERPVHGCGAATAHAGGVLGLDNDAVNLAATLTGALVAALAYSIMGTA